MPDTRFGCGGREPFRRPPIDAIVKRGGDVPAGMSDPGQVDDVVDAVEQATPVEIFRQIRMLHDLDTGREIRLGPPTHRGAEFASTARERRCYSTAEEAGGAGHQKPSHGLTLVHDVSLVTRAFIY